MLRDFWEAMKMRCVPGYAASQVDLVHVLGLLESDAALQSKERDMGNGIRDLPENEPGGGGIDGFGLIAPREVYYSEGWGG